jgi:cytoskeletal protein CcmA (bactofilin family)
MSDTRLRRLRDRTGGPPTLINDGCKISGLITGDGDFVVNGEIDGDCDLGGTVTLSKNARWSGMIKAGDVIVAGHVDGDIVASGRVEITNTARITGTVTGEAIAVAEGAVVEGVMRTKDKTAPVEFTEKRTNE